MCLVDGHGCSDAMSAVPCLLSTDVFICLPSRECMMTRWRIHHLTTVGPNRLRWVALGIVLVLFSGPSSYSLCLVHYECGSHFRGSGSPLKQVVFHVNHTMVPGSVNPFTVIIMTCLQNGSVMPRCDTIISCMQVDCILAYHTKESAPMDNHIHGSRL